MKTEEQNPRITISLNTYRTHLLLVHQDFVQPVMMNSEGTFIRG
ncbi:MAG: hypothetical protein ACR2KZ_13320 [Segetibacter sp.]